MKRSILTLFAVAVVAAAIWYAVIANPRDITYVQEGDSVAVSKIEHVDEKHARYEYARELVEPAGFINTNDESVSITSLIGEKVILVDFWTYSCINCQRTLPYVNAWYEKYADVGLEIIGVHTPEFQFEQKRENVLEAVGRYGIEYPVVLDNAYGTWLNYGNRYWPRKYLIDIDGYIVYDHIGEGAYDETEAMIRDLLGERNKRLGISEAIDSVDVAPETGLAQGHTTKVSRETYLGSARNTFLGNGIAGKNGQQTFTQPKEPNPNVLYFDGMWRIDKEFAESTEAGGSIIYRFRAQDVFMVMEADSRVEVDIFLDGEPVTVSAGKDVIDDGGRSYVEVSEPRLYRLIEHDEVQEGTIEIRVPDAGVRAFAFTFG